MEENNKKLELLIDLENRILQPFILIWNEKRDRKEECVKKCEEFIEFLDKEKVVINSAFDNSLWEKYHRIAEEEKNLFLRLGEPGFEQYSLGHFKVTLLCYYILKGGKYGPQHYCQVVDDIRDFSEAILGNEHKRIIDVVLDAYSHQLSCAWMKQFLEPLGEKLPFISAYLDKCNSCQYHKTKIEGLKLK
jgi:hypothetical protein